MPGDATTGDRHVVVTGGAGFVGSHLVDRILEDGTRVTVVDNYCTGRRRNLTQHANHDRLRTVEHDVREPLPAIGRVDCIYHLASRASPVDFERHGTEIATTNARGIEHVLERARDEDATVVFASTSEVYGDPEVHPQPVDYHGNVDPRGVRGPYDESKRFGEAVGMAYAREHDVDFRTVRIFNTYGPRMRRDDGRVIPTFVAQALRDDPLTVHGDGQQTRSFCYVSDLVEGVLALGRTPGLAGEVVNLGNTNEITIRRLADIVIDLVGSDAEVTHEPRPPNDPDVRRPDISRARRLLDWEPTVPIRAGLATTVEYFRDVEDVTESPAD